MYFKKPALGPVFLRMFQPHDPGNNWPQSLQEFDLVDVIFQRDVSTPDNYLKAAHVTLSCQQKGTLSAFEK